MSAHFPHLAARSDGPDALERFDRAHSGDALRPAQLRTLGAEALASAAAVLGVDPVALGFGLRDGQIATALTAPAPLVSAEIAERRLEIAVASIAGWAESLARQLRWEASRQADRLSALAEEIRREGAHMQHLLYRQGTVRHTRPFVHSPTTEETPDDPTVAAPAEDPAR
jgi:hypothetical protein